MKWKTARRTLPLERPLVMGILNVTPDSFSDGGRYAEVDAALRRAEQMIQEGVDIIDVGGESTRPGSRPIDPDIELNRTCPAVAAIVKRFDIPVSIDTSKHSVAKANIDTGAEIVNDVSGLRWDARIADVVSAAGAGLVLMHSRGEFTTMHSQPPVDDIVDVVNAGLAAAVSVANARGVGDESIVLDVGIGFGKTVEQNLELIAQLGRISVGDKKFPLLVGASRKSFMGKLLGEVTAADRLGGSIAAAAVAVLNGASLVRMHDVRESVETVRIAAAIRGKT
jgi:dihydropteroate synthase